MTPATLGRVVMLLDIHGPMSAATLAEATGLDLPTLAPELRPWVCALLRDGPGGEREHVLFTRWESSARVREAMERAPPECDAEAA